MSFVGELFNAAGLLYRPVDRIRAWLCFEAVPDARFGQDIARVGGICFELAAEIPDATRKYSTRSE
jgi:hypothetical protein